MDVVATAAATAFISSTIGAVVAGVISHAKAGAREGVDTQRAMKEGMRCIMRKEIMDIHRETTERGYITQAEHEHISQVYGVYHTLGGNGTATKLLHDMDNLPARDKVYK